MYHTPADQCGLTGPSPFTVVGHERALRVQNNMMETNRLKYHESPERSAEHLRHALQHIVKHRAAYHPITFAVWYEYVCGANAPLKNEIDAIVASDRLLDEQGTRRLYEMYVADISEQSAARFIASIRHVLHDVDSSAALTGADASRFHAELTNWGSVVRKQAEGAALGEQFKLMVEQTQLMQASVATLQQRLESSHHEIGELREELNRVREVAMVDGLTGLLNRTAFDRRIATLMAEQKHLDDRRLCLAMVDIDHFKRVNDTFGHVFGDQVLVAIAGVLKETVKGGDPAARYGGEEFAILLPNTPLEGARVVGEQVRESVSRRRVKRGDKVVANVTVSVGVTAYREGEPAATFIERADEALYSSKHDGRNRVTVAA